MEIRHPFPKIVVPSISESGKKTVQHSSTTPLGQGGRTHSGSSQPEIVKNALVQTHNVVIKRYGMSRLRVLYGAMRERTDLSLDEEAKIAADTLIKLLKIQGISACKDFLAQRYPDPSKQFIILSELEFSVKDKDTSEHVRLKEALQALMEGLYEEKSVELKAGLNTAEVFDQAIKDQQDSQLTRSLLREFYRSFLVAEVRPSAFLQRLLEKYSCEEIEDILKAILSGASEDLNSPLCSSTNRVYFCLNNISTGNLILQVLKTFKFKVYRIWQFSQSLSENSETKESIDISKIHCNSNTFPFKKGWQYLAVDFLNMTGLLSNPELVKHIFINKHLKEEHTIPKLSRVAIRYLSLIKDSFADLPSHVFVPDAVPGGFNPSADAEKKALINKFYWVDTIQDMYGGRKTQADWMRC